MVSMKSSCNKELRRQPIFIGILPLITLFWVIGWILYYMGSQNTLPTKISKEKVIIQKVILKDNGEHEGVKQQIIV